MISIPFYYSKDNNLKLLVQFDNWFSRQKKFILRVNGEKIDESDVADGVFVGQAGENFYAIRFEQNFLTPTLYIDKESFVLGEKLKWHDYLLIFLFTFFTVVFPPLVFDVHSYLGIFIWPGIYFIARYISLSHSLSKRYFIWKLVHILIGLVVFLDYHYH